MLQPYTQAELLEAVGKRFPEGGTDLKAVVRECHPAIRGNVYTVRYRSEAVEKILVTPPQEETD